MTITKNLKNWNIFKFVKPSHILRALNIYTKILLLYLCNHLILKKTSSYIGYNYVYEAIRIRIMNNLQSEAFNLESCTYYSTFVVRVDLNLHEQRNVKIRDVKYDT